MKNLKSIFFTCAFFCSLFGNAQSDKGFYTNINVGYNKGTASINYLHSLLLTSVNTTETNATTTQYEGVALTLGDGLTFGANLGYMFNKNIGFELGANYLMGSNIKSNSTSYTGSISNRESSAKMLQIKPTLVFRAGYDKINPYAKIGLLIGSGKITSSENGKDASGNTSEQTRELSGGTSIGFHASLGALYKISDKISLFGELNLTSLEYAPKKMVVTVFTQNGVDQLPTLTVNDKEIQFVDSFTDNSLPSNPNEPDKILKVPFSFDSIGLNVGIQYHF